MVLGGLETPTVNWRDTHEFRCIDLEDSFILGWKYSQDTFTLSIEYSLRPGHKEYETPKENEYTCYKKGKMVFAKVTKLTGLIPMQSAQTSTDLDGAVDYGNIEILMLGANGLIELFGEFGELTFYADFPVLVFEH